MAATTTVRVTEFAGLVPARGTGPVYANTRLISGTIVCVDPTTGDLVAGGTVENANAIGKCSANYDNLTTSRSGGAAGAIDAEVEFGVFGWAYTGNAPKAGQVVYVVDNQTVSLDSDSGARGIAGYCSELRNGKCYVLMGPTVVGQIVIAADVAADVLTLQGEMDELQADALSEQTFLPIPLTAWAIADAPLTTFEAGSANGLCTLDSECLAIRVDPSVGGTLPVLSTSVVVPPDLDVTSDIVLHILCGRIGAADTDVVLSGAAFCHPVGAAYDADADAITADTSALASATKVVDEKTLTIAAANLTGANPGAITFQITPSSALDADDLIILGTSLEYTRALRTS